MAGRLIILILVLAGLSVLSALALIDVGYFGILEPHFHTRAQRSVKEVVEKFYQELDDIEEIVIIAKDREGEWIFANSELENELEWIGSLYKFINKAILEDDEDF